MAKLKQWTKASWLVDIRHGLRDTHRPIHTIAVILSTHKRTHTCSHVHMHMGETPVEPYLPQSATWPLHTLPAEASPMARQTTPRQMLRNPLLSFMLTFASWMLRPFLFKVSFTPFIQLVLGLPLLLTPLTSESYTLLTNLSFPILSTCPNHLRTP